jgi:tripartite-type tricarboxylate transporter receptor subunit TctC
LIKTKEITMHYLKFFVLSFFAVLSLMIVPSQAQPATSSTPLRIIVAFPPGGAPDIAARMLGTAMSPKLGQPVFVENRTGAGGLVGAMGAASSKDGHTLFMATASLAILPSLNPSVGYDLERDFDPIGWVSSFPAVLVVPAKSKFNTFAELLADMKARPGQMLCGNGGIGTSAHLGLELFLELTKTSCNGVPYRGEGALVPALMVNEVEMAFANLPGILPQIRAGTLRALAVASDDPVPELPEVPTLRSLGIPGTDVQGWVVLLASKGMSPERLAQLESLLEKTLTEESVRKTLVASGIRPVVGGSNKLRAYLKSEYKRWGDVIRSRGIKPQ